MSTKLDKSNSRLSAPVYSQVATTPKRRHSTERRVMSTLQPPPQPAPRRSSSSNRSAGFTAAAASPSPSARSQSRRSPAPSAPPVDVDATYGGGYAQPDYERVAKFQPSMFADSYSRVAAQRGASPAAAGRRNTNENAQPQQQPPPQPEVLKPELPTLRRRSTSHERK